MWTIVVPVAIPAATGLAFIAYRHPTSYTRLFLVLLGLTYLAYFLVGAFDFGLDTAKSAAVIALKTSADPAVIGKSIEDVSIPSAYAVVGLLAVTFYLTFLFSFRFWLHPEPARPSNAD